jgi:hypothetical protein
VTTDAATSEIAQAESSTHPTPELTPPLPAVRKKREPKTYRIGTCTLCKREKLKLDLKKPYCLEYCLDQIRDSSRGRTPRETKTMKAGHQLLIALFERYLNGQAQSCMTELAAALGGKFVTPTQFAYLPMLPTKPTRGQVFSAIVGKYDSKQQLLPAIREGFTKRQLFVPKHFGKLRRFHITEQPPVFSLINYLTPSNDAALAHLRSLTERMNAVASQSFMPAELMLAVDLYHARVAQLQRPTLANLWEVFDWVRIKVMKDRVLRAATDRYADDPKRPLTIAEAQKLNLLIKAERDLLGEIGGSTRSAKRLNMTSGDAFSEFIERAPRAGHRTMKAGDFSIDDELPRAKTLLALEATVGAEAAVSDLEPMPEEEVEAALEETITELRAAV